MKTLSKHRHRTQKAMRTRARLRSVTTRPRLSVFRSLNNISCQIIDDSKGHTVASASTLEADLRTFKGDKTEKAKKVGELVAERAKKAGVEAVVFDRGGNRFAGRVAAIAEGAREGGLAL